MRVNLTVDDGQGNVDDLTIESPSDPVDAGEVPADLVAEIETARAAELPDVDLDEDDAGHDAGTDSDVDAGAAPE